MTFIPKFRHHFFGSRLRTLKCAGHAGKETPLHGFEKTLCGTVRDGQKRLFTGPDISSFFLNAAVCFHYGAHC